MVTIEESGRGSLMVAPQYIVVTKEGDAFVGKAWAGEDGVIIQDAVQISDWRNLPNLGKLARNGPVPGVEVERIGTMVVSEVIVTHILGCEQAWEWPS